MPQYQGVWNLAQQAQALTSQQWVTDPLFDYTTLLLQADNVANGAQNNTFLDSSTANGGLGFPITRNGNTTQGSFSPFSLQPGAWGNYFNGSTDYITTSNANFAMGTSNFTVECWVYLTAYPTGTNTDGYIATWLNNSGNGFWLGTDGSSGKLAGYVGQGASADGVSAGVVPLNTWVHTAFTRNGSTLTIWMNGVSVGSTTTSRSLDRTPLAIGSTYSSSIFTYKTTGYISNARVISGQCLYTGTFTPSTAPLTTTSVGSIGPGAASSLTGTVTLLASQSNRFVDNSASANTLTISGTPSVQAFSPFAPQFQYTPTVTGGSGYFDGTGDYLSIARNSVFFPVANTDFTFEAWIYPTATPGPQGAIIVGAGEYGLDSDWDLDINSSLQLAMYINSSPATAYRNTTTTVRLNAWNHIAASRSGTGSNNLKVFVNGVGQSFTTNQTTVGTGSRALTIGADVNGDEANYTGYISGLRLINGQGIYTADFTPPTAPPTTTSGGVTASNTVLLINATNAGILDGTMKNNVETLGTTQVSTAVVKYGSGSISFDGTDDYLLIPPTQNLEFGSGDFTIEFWWFPTSTARQALYHGSFGTDWSVGIDYSGVSTNQKIGIWASSNGTSWNLINADSGGSGIGVTPPTQNAWNHIAYVRNGNTWMLFVNGRMDLNLTNISGSIVNRASSQKGIGVWYNTTAMAEASGYMDDFRITKGVARYTRSFTPPQVALPRQ